MIKLIKKENISIEIEKINTFTYFVHKILPREIGRINKSLIVPPFKLTWYDTCSNNDRK